MFEQLVLVDHPNIVKLHKYWLDVKDSKARVGARGGCRPGWEGRRWDPGVLCSPCSQDSLSSGSKLGRISSLKPIRHWHGLPRGAEESPSLGVLQNCGDVALQDTLQWAGWDGLTVRW